MTKCTEAKDEFGIKRIKADAAAREAALVGAAQAVIGVALWDGPEIRKVPEWLRPALAGLVKATAATSPAAAALLAQGEALEAIRQEVQPLMGRTPVGEARAFAIAERVNAYTRVALGEAKDG